MYKVAIELYKKADQSDLGKDHSLYDLWLHQKESSITFETYPTRELAEQAMAMLAGNVNTASVKREG